jgi:hypothetical protein
MLIGPLTRMVSMNSLREAKGAVEEELVVDPEIRLM